MTTITDTIAELERLTKLNKKLKKERDEINTTAKEQRKEIRRLKRVLKQAIDLIPNHLDGRYDKFFEEADALIYKDEDDSGNPQVSGPH